MLLNVALHGMGDAVGVRYAPDGVRTALTSPVLVRYCDDFVVCCHTRQQAEAIQTQLAGWLAPRGLTLNPDKTRIVSLEEGYTFLGVTIRRYRNGKLLIKPSATAVKRIKHHLAERLRTLRGQNVGAVLAEICPITRGWASFYRSVVAKKTFTNVDDHLWKLTYRWARRSHPRKPMSWIKQRYFGQFNPTKANQWVFGDATSGAHLPRMAWTPIVRHRKVMGAASPDDPALTDYWNHRRGHNPPPLPSPVLRLLKVQRGRCALCTDLLLHADREPHTPDEWRQWHRTTRTAITRQHITARGRDGQPDEHPIRLVHTSCHRKISDTTGDRHSHSPAPEPLWGLA